MLAHCVCPASLRVILIFRAIMPVSGIPNQRLGIPETRKHASNARNQGFRGLPKSVECAGFKYDEWQPRMLDEVAAANTTQGVTPCAGSFQKSHLTGQSVPKLRGCGVRRR